MVTVCVRDEPLISLPLHIWNFRLKLGSSIIGNGDGTDFLYRRARLSLPTDRILRHGCEGPGGRKGEKRGREESRSSASCAPHLWLGKAFRSDVESPVEGLAR